MATDSYLTNPPAWDDGSHIHGINNYAERAFLAILYCIIGMVGIVGNLFVMAAVLLSRKLQTATNVFIISLSVTDLLVSIVQPFQAVGLLGPKGWPLHPVICAIAGSIVVTAVSCSVLTLALIAINRYILITRSRKDYRRIYTPSKMALMVILSWMYPIVTLVVPQAAGHGKLGFDINSRLCAWDFMHPIAYVYQILAGILSMMSFMLIVMSYTFIYRHVREHVRNTMATASKAKLSPSKPSPNKSSETEKVPPAKKEPGQKKVHKPTRLDITITKNLLYVICGFFMCVLPYTVLLFATTFVKSPGLISHVSSYLALVLVFDSCLNPIIYALKHPNFKIVFGCMVRCEFSRIPEPSRFLRRFLSSSTLTDSDNEARSRQSNTETSVSGMHTSSC
ncbi:G-protein coupled receptor moody-like [Lytechinus pictus]|uniref:G-protein coupled receptor moody-like n=1 Tax=Lytechinus pictus TaxID=7653 RepID=UPI00240E102C|nr:G-protein coupled receptor moody-like [Lytechinus pictus]